MCLRLIQTLSPWKETTEDEPRSGWPLTSRTPDVIGRGQQMLAQDWRVTLRLMVEELGISKDTVHTIIRERLGKHVLQTWRQSKNV